MKVVFKVAIAAALSSAAAPGLARADRRDFTNTYGYPTQAEGNIELELGNTQVRDGLGEDGGTSEVEQQVELEYGITDHTSISLYQVVAEAEGSGLHYAETKVEMRHRLSERGELPVDVTLYGEVAKIYGEAAVELEPKLILARDFGQLTIAVNLIPEIVLVRSSDGDGGHTIDATLVPGWAAGATYELSPAWHFGAETWGERDEEEVVVGWAGPAASWSPSPKFWVAATAGAGLTADSADLAVRFLASVQL
jgi:hypothetical protein